MGKTFIAQPETGHTQLDAAAPSPALDAEAPDRRESRDEVAELEADEISDDALSRHEHIARLAYAYWEARGRPDGSPEEDWFQAEAEIRALDAER